MKTLLHALAVFSGQTVATTDSAAGVRLYFQNMHDEAFLLGKGVPQPFTANVVGEQFVADVTKNPDNKLFDFAGMALGLLYKDKYDELTKSNTQYGVYMGYCHPEFVWLLYDVTKWTPKDFPNTPGQDSTKPILNSPGGGLSGRTVKAQSHCTGTSGRAGVVASFTANENTSAAEFMSRRKKNRMVVAVMHWSHPLPSKNVETNQHDLVQYLRKNQIGFDPKNDELIVLADTNIDVGTTNNYPFLQSLYTELGFQIPQLSDTAAMPLPSRSTCCTNDGFTFSDSGPDQKKDMVFNSTGYKFDRIWSTLDLKSDDPTVEPVIPATPASKGMPVDPFHTMYTLSLDNSLGYHEDQKLWGALVMHNPVQGTYTLGPKTP